MKPTLLFFSLLFSIASANAEVLSFKKETCTVDATSTLQLAIGDEKIASDVKVEFVVSGAAILLPRIRLSFLTHEPATASVQWDDINISKSRVQMFTNDIVEHVRLEEGRPFEMKRISPPGQVAVFETVITNFGRAQNLVALFLSQSKMTINAAPEEGDVWAAEHSLKNSDDSVRQLAFNCFPAKTTGYLDEKGQRLSVKADPGPNKVKMASSAQLWSDGYGLVNYSFINDQLPMGFRYPFEIVKATDDETVANQKLADLYRLAKEKKETETSFIQATTQPEYVELNNQLTVQYQKLQSLYDRFVVVTGENDQSTNSLLAQKLSEQQTLSTTIASLSTQISAEKQVESPLQQTYDTATAELAPQLAQLTMFENEIETRNKRIQDIKLLQAHLAELLVGQEEILKRNNTWADGQSSAPWSIEEIEKQIKVNENRQAQIEVIQLLRTQLESISGELSVLVEKANSQQTTAFAYAESVALQGRLKHELQVEEEWLFQDTQIPHFTVAPIEYFSDLNKAFETQITEAKVTRNFDGEYDYHEQQYQKTETAFLAQLEQAKTAGQSLIAAVLCKPDVFFDATNRKTPCLTVDDALDAQKVENFFDALPTQNLNSLMTNVQKPWQQSVSKTRILIDRFQQELNSAPPQLQALVEIWGQLRHLMWRWFVLQPDNLPFASCTDAKANSVIANNTYSAAYYETIFNCEKAANEVHRSKKASIVASLQQADAGITSTLIAFDAADQDFEVSSGSFVASAMAKVNSVSEQMDFTKLFTSCVLPLESAEDCAASVTLGVTRSQEKITTEQTAYLDIAKALVLNINAQASLMSQENSNLVNEITQVEANKQTHITTSNLEALIAREKQLKTQLAAVEKQITDLTKSEEDRKAELASAIQGEMLLRTEASKLVTDIQAVLAQINLLLPTYKPYCSAILPSSNRLQQIDTSIYEVLGQTQNTAEAKVYSSCQMPNLENYIPNRAILNSAPLATTR